MKIRLLIVLLSFLLLSSSCEQVTRPSGQILRLNLSAEPPTLDSRKATDATSVNILMMLFEGLTRVGVDHQPHPACAESITVSQDQRTYTFKLRPTLWSDGTPVTADDFVYAWKSLLDPKFPSYFAYKLYVIKNAQAIKEGLLPIEALGVEVPDEKTVIVHLAHPVPYFLELVAFPTFFPICKRNDSAHPNWSDEATDHYTNNGPFRLKTWRHDDEIEVVRNPHYWDAPKVHLEKIKLTMINDATTEFYMFEMDELDWAGSPLSNLPPDFLGALQREHRVERMPATGVYYYKLNVEAYPLNNRNIRKALGLAIDRQAIVDHIAQGGQLPALGLVPPMPGWEIASHFFEDNAKEYAVRLFEQGLKEMGLTRQSFPHLKLCFNTNREHHKIAQAIQQQWKEVLGIEVELENYDWKVYLSKVNKQDYQIARTGWIGDFHDPISFLEPFKYKDDPKRGGNNETGWENSAYTSFLDAANEEISQTKRSDYLRKAEKTLIDEMPIIPLYYISFNFMKKNHVHSVYISPLGIADYKEAFIE